MTWRSLIPFAAIAGCLLTGGCSITRKSASIDSVSKIPFFGLELGTKQRAPAPETQRIRFEGSIPLEPEPARLVTPAGAKDASWWQRIKGSEKRSTIAIPIPRTDLTVAPLAPQSLEVSATDEDDQTDFQGPERRFD